MAQPKRVFFLLALIFCCFELHETSARGSKKSIRKKCLMSERSAFESSSPGPFTSTDTNPQFPITLQQSNGISPPPPLMSPVLSSVSKELRREQVYESESVSPTSSPILHFYSIPNSEKKKPHVRFDSALPTLYACYETYPLDLLAQRDPLYLNYLSSKSVPDSSLKSSSNDEKAKLENCLKLKTCSIWQVVKKIESFAFYGLKLAYLNDLPLIYLKRRALGPFKAFLLRFKYTNEFHLLFERDPEASGANIPEKSFSTPFAILVMKFTEPGNLEDPFIDPFFKFLVESQTEAFEPLEFILFDAWLRIGKTAWRFIKFYFEISLSRTKSASLIHVLTDSKYSGPLTKELMKYLLSIKSFNINEKISYAMQSGKIRFNDPTAFLHVLAYEARFATNLLPIVLADARLHATVPTGKIVLRFEEFELAYTDAPVLFLAVILRNVLAVIHLHRNTEIMKGFRSDKFVIFLAYHILLIIWLSFDNMIKKLANVSIKSAS